MRARPAVVVLAAAAIVGLGALQAWLGVASEQTAALFPEVADLRVPVLVLAVAFCATGQVAALVVVVRPRVGRPVVAILLVAMAGLLVAIVAVTMAWHATPPLVALGGWGGALALTVGAAALSVGGRQRGITPAARAGSA